ncbi:CopD family protein [Flavihumibacter profundi]|uniref:CopD family protein n=1 Tax=Flavihumibacter profundi TaxID=2716883 RepID=UPI0021D42D46|nr:CopD family protein [Flavihumibacter profundi]
MYTYLKALHIIFVVTWFAGMFYMPRLFIYATEAGDRPGNERDILRGQFAIMMRRLWYGITWPSAILTLILGTWVMVNGKWDRLLFDTAGQWLLLKLIFVVFLYVYHFTLHHIFRQEMNGIYKYSSNQLRLWNEGATVFLFAIVMLVVVKESMSLVYGLGGIVLLIVALFAAIKIYKNIREKGGQ